MDAKAIYQNFTQKLVWRRRDSYRRLFLDDRGGLLPDAEIALADLKRFCNGAKSSIRLGGDGNVDPYAMAVAEGRREVWNRINAYLYIDDKTVTNLTEME